MQVRHILLTTSKGRRDTCMVSKHLHVINDVSHHRIPGIGYYLERSKHSTVSIRPKDGMTVIDLANYVSSPEDSTVERQGIFGAQIQMLQLAASSRHDNTGAHRDTMRGARERA